MNKTIGIIVALIVILGGLYLVMNAAPKEKEVGSGAESTAKQSAEAKGRVVFSVTDAAANMSAISEINMRVSGVTVKEEGGAWVTVSTAPRVYSLLELNASGKSELLADAQVAAGTYKEVRLMVDSVSVKTKAGATSVAKLPSGELKIKTELVVNEGGTASINFDFLADKSLHTTGSGEYIFAPVVKTEARSNANVTIASDNVVAISGGKVDDTNTVGMDIDGSVKLNFQIKSNQKLNIEADNTIKIGL